MNCTSTRELNNGLYHYISYFIKNLSRFPNCCTSIRTSQGYSSWLIEYWRERKMELRKLSFAHKFFVYVKFGPQVLRTCAITALRSWPTSEVSQAGIRRLRLSIRYSDLNAECRYALLLPHIGAITPRRHTRMV